ncbi:hypothetical protein GCM10010498_05950 [Streptomyces cavourensis]|nr:hypothetical protein GCM10010498_05950 [Streptomyces cavourensis]
MIEADTSAAGMRGRRRGGRRGDGRGVPRDARSWRVGVQADMFPLSWGTVRNGGFLNSR